MYLWVKHDLTISHELTYIVVVAATMQGLSETISTFIVLKT